MEEALANVREVIEVHLLALREDGQEIPEEREILVERVDVWHPAGSDLHSRYH